jgi:hypothetical protein
MITRGVLCVTPREERSPNLVLIQGKQEEITPVEALDLDLKTKVVIKGANAVDPDGTAGVLMAAPDGGTVGKLLGRVMAAGHSLIVPVGLEKLVPSVARAVRLLGKQRLGRSLGAYAGMMPLVGASVITEKQALEGAAKVTVTQVAAGGIGGSEGAVTLLLEGERGQLETAIKEVEQVKGTRAPEPVLQQCGQCNHLCDFRGLTENALPEYLS